MFFSTVELPEPFRSALSSNRAADVGNAPADTPEALFGRGHARAIVGRDEEARSDFEAASTAIKEPCQIELAWLDLRAGRARKEVAPLLSSIAARNDLPAMVVARAWHILGLAEGKARRTDAAIDALLQAADHYEKAASPLARAQVFDTLGNVEAARGMLHNALHYYAMSLVDKALSDDRWGIAITLGNIGRAELRAGRYQQAIDCFQRDLELSDMLGDERGRARMHEDLGRTYLAMEEYQSAEQQLSACLELAQRLGFPDLRFFAQKDMALLRIAQGRLDGAAHLLQSLRASLTDTAPPFFAPLLDAVEGELRRAHQDRHSTDFLQRAADQFTALNLPDEEIPTRIALAKALAAQGYPALAEESLLRATKVARAEGYMRYLPLLNEAMAGLDLVEGALQETGQKIAAEHAAAGSAYIVRQQLGGGAFGQVVRAYDTERSREVAIKRLRLEQLYDPAQRRRLLASARRELEAASRLRHPGIVRVFALGTEPDGTTYVVQEFVAGQCLRNLMPSDNSADVLDVILHVQQIALALAALHEAGIVHRDLKPDNVLVRPDGSIVLVDFGIASVSGVRAEFDDKIAGTIPYMPPEQIEGRRVDARCDLYALGVLAYEWLAGTRPLDPQGASWKALALDVYNRKPLPISDFRPQLDPRLSILIARLLEKKPRRRPATALEVASQCAILAEVYRHEATA